MALLRLSGGPRLLFLVGTDVRLLKGPALLGAALLGLHLLGARLAAAFGRLGGAAELHGLLHVLLLAFLTSPALLDAVEADHLVGLEAHASDLLLALVMQVPRVLDAGVDEKARVAPVLHDVERTVDLLLPGRTRLIGGLCILNRLQGGLGRPALVVGAVGEHLLRRLHADLKLGLVGGRSGDRRQHGGRHQSGKKKSARLVHREKPS